VRIHSGIALACMGDARGIPVCAAMMDDAPSWIRYYAVYGLWVTNTTRARNILSRYKRDKDTVVGPAVIRALSAPFAAPPPVPRGLANTNRVTALHVDVFLDGCDIMIAEADWWWHKGNFDQSIRCLEAAVFLYPTYVDGYSSIAWLHWSLGREADAVRALKRAVETMPRDPEPYFELGLHYYRTSRYELAEEPLAKALQLGPDFRTRRMYAHCLEKVGKLEDAVRQWTTIVNEDPSDSIANRNLQRVKQLLQKKNGPWE
ncbi:MAG: tetratricopeptide repeat protein, partial [Armatimonadota bacterium]